MTIFENMDPIAILVAAIMGMVLGGLWYSPLLFADAWLKAIGKTQDELGSPTPAMIGSMCACLAAAAAVEFFIVSVGAHSVMAWFLG